MQIGAPSPKQFSIAENRAFVALIGYQDQGNLGLGYLSAVLQAQGYDVEMIDFCEDADHIAQYLISHQPLVVGFSLIFQCFLPDFKRVAGRLRSAGITSHFTIGGHFPSLCPEEVLKQIPELDSVVICEGEETLVKLVQRLSKGQDPLETSGIAYLCDDEVVKTKPRALVQDLDSLPFPHRPYEPEKIGVFHSLPLLASRGCMRRCSFCSIHMFYRNAPGKVVRIRRPKKVVEEMLHLHHRHNACIFLFQDDDFPLWSTRGRRWAEELAGHLHDSGLAGRTLWKISCRAEHVELDLFSKLRDAGLFLVYLGLESGDEESLNLLNKGITTEQNFLAMEKLKQLDIPADYGFMLFDPSSSFDSIRRNIDFLRLIAGDGRSAVHFSRMLPYGGTPIREQLQQDGRLRGDNTSPDYTFQNLRLNEYYQLLCQSVGPWLDARGFSDDLNYARYELETARRLVPEVQGVIEYRTALRSLTAESNKRLLLLVEESSLAFEQGERSKFDAATGQDYCEKGRALLLDMRNQFVFENIEVLKEASDPVTREYR